MRRNNPVLNKTIYVDVMKNGRFYTQLAYTYCPLWPVDLVKVSEWVMEQLPSLSGNRVDLSLSTNRV